LQSYLIVAELTGCQPLHEAIPALAEALDPEVIRLCHRAATGEKYLLRPHSN